MLNQVLLNALRPICSNVYPDVYTGKETEYIVFTFDIRPDNFGDDFPFHLTYDVRVHYLAPLKKDVIRNRVNILVALSNIVGATYPEEVNATDEEGQHYVYDFQVMGESYDEFIED